MADNDKIIDMTKALARALQIDERYQKLDAVRKENDADEKLQGLIGKFNLTRMNLDKALSDEAQDSEKIQSLNTDTQQIYAEIMANEGMQKYQEASGDIESLINYINAIITTAIQGGNPDEVNAPSACSGSCESCGGCH